MLSQESRDLGGYTVELTSSSVPESKVHMKGKFVQEVVGASLHKGVYASGEGIR